MTQSVPKATVDSAMADPAPAFSRLDRMIGRFSEWMVPLLRRRGAVPLLVVFLWACAALPNLAVRSFVWEEGTNAEIARDVLAHGHFLRPIVYGLSWHEKPSLLAWLIAAFSTITGEVNEWSARLPSMLAVLITALLVQRITRRYASAGASLFAALAFMFCPLVLQKITIAEPDTVATMLSFAAFLLWWDGMAAGRVTLLRWIGCGLLLAVLAMAKGPQLVGFFSLGVLASLIVARRWRDLPGWFLSMLIPASASIAWGAAVYQPGDETLWLSYARIGSPPDLAEYIRKNFTSLVLLLLELMPGLLLLPFVPLPWRRHGDAPAVPPVSGPLILYTGVCTAALIVWPGFNSRYAMPIAPSLAVLAGFGWDALEQSGPSLLRRLTAGLIGLFVAYQMVLVVAVMPLFADRFGASRNDGKAIEQALRAAPAPAYCTSLDTNQLFYVRLPVQCLRPPDLATLEPPAWLIAPRDTLSEFERLRDDLDVRPVVETTSGPQLTAARIEKK